MGAVKAALLERMEEEVRVTCPDCNGACSVLIHKHRVRPTEDGIRVRVDKWPTSVICDRCDGMGSIRVTDPDTLPF